MMRRLVVIVALGALAGCTLAPRYVRPALPVQPSWPVGDAYLRQSEAALPSVGYRDIFRDPRLQQLIEQALVNNRDLRIAAAQIASARAQYRIQRAQLFPVIDASAGANFRDAGSGATSGGTGSNDSYSADVGTTAFEIDLFGRVRSLSNASLNRYFATEAAARSTRLVLVATIANAWLTYAADQSLLKIAADTASSASRSVNLTRARLDGGVAPRTDLRQAETVLAQAQSDLAAQKTALAQDRNLLQLLVGAPFDPALLPGSIEEAGTTLAELPAGLESTILLRRPDVLEAEYQLRAANAEIGAARAALFPRITLTGLVGFASEALKTLFTSDAFGLSISPGVSYAIFSGDAARNGVSRANADRDAAVASYEKAIQTAFREVSDALARRGTISDQVTADTRRVDAASDNYRLSDARYRGGIDTFLQSLDAQRSFYSAQRTLVNTQLIRAANLVDLYQTLGGDALAEGAD